MVQIQADMDACTKSCCDGDQVQGGPPDQQNPVAIIFVFPSVMRFQLGVVVGTILFYPIWSHHPTNQF